MTTFKYPDDKVMAFWAAIYRSDTDAMRRLAKEDPSILHKLRKRNCIPICEAGARSSSPDAVRTLVDLGADVDEQDGSGWTGLCWAIAKDEYETAKALLESGAGPNLHCPMFAVAYKDLQDPIGMAELLLAHGADVNQPVLAEGLPPRNVLSEAMANDRAELVEFLKSRGATLPDSAPAAAEPTDSPEPSILSEGRSKDIVAHFDKHFGRPQRSVIREIVPVSENPFVIHYIKPSSNRHDGKAVLFTDGLSRCEMPVPEGAEQYRRVELMLRLDKSWPAPLNAIRDPRWAWPIQWMRRIAAYRFETSTWLGAPWSVLVEAVPPRPLGPGTNFTAWFLAAFPIDKDIIQCKDGTTIQIYEMFPIYTEEYWFERKHGADALVSLLVEHDIQMHIDLNRPNVALRKV